jgi:hypothetical protein
LLQVQARGRAPREEVLDGLATMDGRPVPDDEELARILRKRTRRKRTTSGLR